MTLKLFLILEKKESDLLNKNQEIPEYMYPKNDFIFKRLFGYEGNEEITKDLVSSIIGKPIKTLEFKNPYLLRETKDDKEEILDIKACLDNNIQCDIEIQVGNNHDVEKRILDSWSKMYRQSIGKSKKYENMKRTIVIFITTFDIDGLKGIEKYRTRWQILEENLKVKLTDVFEIDIIELSKAKRQAKTGIFEESKSLREWVTFLINPKELEETWMEKMSEEVKKAYELWQSLNLNQEERELAEKRFMELSSQEYAKQYEKELGRREGRQELQKEIAKEMLEKGFDKKLIAEITKLSIEEIDSIK